jgi:hypothetical protein
MSEDKTKVSSIREEYEKIRKTPCKCGGNYKKVMQALVKTDDGGHADYILVECDKCSEQKEFYFDVNSFVGKSPDEQG